MTLGEFFQVINQNPIVLVFFFIAIPLTTILAGILGKGQGHLSPWKYLYSTIVYLTCIPGIFSLVFNIYMFLFERQEILNTNIYTQILPILVMIFNLWVITKNVKFSQIPGFDTIWGLLITTLTIVCFMWILEKTHIVIFSYMPFMYVLIIMVVLFGLLRYGVRKLMF